MSASRTTKCMCCTSRPLSCPGKPDKSIARSIDLSRHQVRMRCKGGSELSISLAPTLPLAPFFFFCTFLAGRLWTSSWNHSRQGQLCPLPSLFPLVHGVDVPKEWHLSPLIVTMFITSHTQRWAQSASCHSTWSLPNNITLQYAISPCSRQSLLLSVIWSTLIPPIKW